MVRGAWRTELNAVGLECTSLSFKVGGGGGEVWLHDSLIAGVCKDDFVADAGKGFDDELLAAGDDVDACEGFSVRLVLGFGAVTAFFVPLAF